MEQIESAFRDAGVVVPFTHNEKGMRSESWSVDYENVGGAVDVYGLDSYPGGLSCTNVETGFNVVRTYYQWFQNYSYTQPEYLPEFEGGWFSAWGSDTFYDEVGSLSKIHMCFVADLSSVLPSTIQLLQMFITRTT